MPTEIETGFFTGSCRVCRVRGSSATFNILECQGSGPCVDKVRVRSLRGAIRFLLAGSFRIILGFSRRFAQLSGF